MPFSSLSHPSGGRIAELSCNLQASFSRISSLIKFSPFFPYCLHVLKEKDRCRKKRVKESEHIAKYLPIPDHQYILAKISHVIQHEYGYCQTYLQT